MHQKNHIPSKLNEQIECFFRTRERKCDKSHFHVVETPTERNEDLSPLWINWYWTKVTAINCIYNRRLNELISTIVMRARVSAHFDCADTGYWRFNLLISYCAVIYSQRVTLCDNSFIFSSSAWTFYNCKQKWRMESIIIFIYEYQIYADLIDHKQWMQLVSQLIWNRKRNWEFIRKT